MLTHAPPARLLDQRIGPFVLAAAALVLSASRRWLSGDAALIMATAALAIAVWHGAYDHVQAKPLREVRIGPVWPPMFVGLYVTLAGAVVLGWWLFPTVSLVLFLTYSAWHFGSASEFKRASLASCVAVFALGAAPVVVACRWQAGEVARLSALMLEGAPDARVR